jgi:hypothetical protein
LSEKVVRSYKEGERKVRCVVENGFIY